MLKQKIPGYIEVKEQRTMTDEEKIKQVLYKYEDGGLISMDIEKVLSCIDDRIIGIGIGEQGFVTSKADVFSIFTNGLKNDTKTKHSLSFSQLHICVYKEGFANLCAKVTVRAQNGADVSKSEFLQSLTLIKRGEDWKICALHASAPIITEESVNAYPLKFAEKTLQSLKEKIGEEAYLAEEQYRQAVLADTVAFYIINFTANAFEKCQLNGNLCVYVEPDTPYEEFLIEKSPRYVAECDRARFLNALSLEKVQEAFENGSNELSCEYHLIAPDGSLVWMVTIIRLITDVVTGEKKGIMYVKDIDEAKRRELDMISRARHDAMTGILNKTAFLQSVTDALPLTKTCSAFIMLDVDDFKYINDTCGHPAGDHVLVSISGILSETFGPHSLIGRIGGDEFAVYLPQAPEKNSLCRRLSYALTEISGIPLDNADNICVTCSVGVTRCTASDTVPQIYQRADTALYASKRAGKNQYTFGD